MRFPFRRSKMPASVVLPFPWRRYALRMVLGGVVGAGLVCARSAVRSVPKDDRTRYHDRSFHVARVVDGDTLDIDVPDGDKSVTRIRLWGVDTPETGLGGRPRMYYGAEATAFARRVLGGRRVHIVLSSKRTRGKYGRLLAYVFLERGGRMFNEMLLEGGYAYADLRFQHPYFDRFRGIEARARRAGVGLWGKITLEQMPAWKQRFERRAAARNP